MKRINASESASSTPRELIKFQYRDKNFKVDRIAGDEERAIYVPSLNALLRAARWFVTNPPTPAELSIEQGNLLLASTQPTPVASCTTIEFAGSTYYVTGADTDFLVLLPDSRGTIVKASGFSGEDFRFVEPVMQVGRFSVAAFDPDPNSN